MKIRTDFVTNSSSSSFIVAFKSKEDMLKSLDDIGTRYGVEVAHRLSCDVQKGKCDRQHILACATDYFERDARFQFIYCNTNYYNMTGQEFYEKYPEVQKEIREYVKRNVATVMDSLPKRGYWSVVSYSDNDGEFYSAMEHDIMPHLACTLLRMSHH